jgi:hypothetical protein
MYRNRFRVVLDHCSIPFVRKTNQFLFGFAVHGRLLSSLEFQGQNRRSPAVSPDLSILTT